MGEEINKLQDQAQLDLSLSDENENDSNARVPTRFRLKAHLKNGQTSVSKPTAGILLYAPKDPQEIVPSVEILSPSSVQLTWDDAPKENKEENKNKNRNKNESETNGTSRQTKTDRYDVEKKEAPLQQDQEQEEQPPSEWEKVTEVPLSQRSVRIDSLTDASQCEFRLVPSSVVESNNTGKTSQSTLLSNRPFCFFSVENQVESEPEPEPEPITVHDISQLLNYAAR